MITVISAWTAHLLSWAASVWLMLGPAYQGVSITTEGTTRVSVTFIETNALHVIWVPIVPVLLSGIALMAVRRTGPGQTGRRLLLWTISVVFLGQPNLGKVIVRHIFQSRRNAPGQLVAAEAQPGQVRQVAQLRRYLPGQLVAPEGQFLQAGETAQFRRYRPGQLVFVEVQQFQVGEVAQLRWYLPGLLVAPEEQAIDPSVRIIPDPVPLPG